MRRVLPTSPTNDAPGDRPIPRALCKVRSVRGLLIQGVTMLYGQEVLLDHSEAIPFIEARQLHLLSLS